MNPMDPYEPFREAVCVMRDRGLVLPRILPDVPKALLADGVEKPSPEATGSVTGALIDYGVTFSLVHGGEDRRTTAAVHVGGKTFSANDIVSNEFGSGRNPALALLRALIASGIRFHEEQVADGIVLSTSLPEAG